MFHIALLVEIHFWSRRYFSSSLFAVTKWLDSGLLPHKKADPGGGDSQRRRPIVRLTPSILPSSVAAVREVGSGDIWNGSQIIIILAA